jgi:type II secretory pathway component GspD/PulD (secretin)
MLSGTQILKHKGHRSRRWPDSAWLSLIVMFLLIAPSLADEPRADDDANEQQEKRIQITSRGNATVDLEVLLGLVATELNLQIAHTNVSLRGKSVAVQGQAGLKRDELLPFFETVLRMNDLALVDMEKTGWKQIVPLNQVKELAKPVQQVPDKGNHAVIQSFKIDHADMAQVESAVRQFLTPQGSTLLSMREQNMLLIVDFSYNMQRVEQLIKVLDQAGPKRQIEFYQAKHLEPQALAASVTPLLQSIASDARAGKSIEIKVIERSRQLAFVGQAEQIAAARELANKLDVDQGIETKVYQFTHVTPDRVDRLARELIGPEEVRRAFRSTVDRDGGLLVIAGTDATHAIVADLKRDLDRPLASSQSPVRSYKLVNAKAADVLSTIESLHGENGLESIEISRANGDADSSDPSRETNPSAATGSNRLQPLSNLDKNQAGRVVADENTNSIIVVASPEVQQVYERLILLLDKRRPQVLIEAVIVTLDTSNSFSLGVEIGTDATFGNNDNRVVTFSSFGIGDPDVDTGSIALRPGVGFNGAMVAPDAATVIVRAVTGHGRSKVLAAPKILVNDNATGTIANVNEAPTTSVNASDTVATTSFSGFASAGTTINVTPHISEGDYLHLEYSVELSAFEGQGSDGVPPPRQRNTISSTVTVPDGYTIIIGGINREDEADARTGIPILDRIPLVKDLTSSQSRNKSQATLFVFLRPIILRDDQFEDLKFLSESEVARAGLPSDFPQSEALLVQ